MLIGYDVYFSNFTRYKFDLGDVKVRCYFCPITRLSLFSQMMMLMFLTEKTIFVYSPCLSAVHSVSAKVLGCGGHSSLPQDQTGKRKNPVCRESHDANTGEEKHKSVNGVLSCEVLVMVISVDGSVSICEWSPLFAAKTALSHRSIGSTRPLKVFRGILLRC